MAGKRADVVRHDGWTKPRREKFLTVLGATANVRAAADAARKGKCTAYTLRKRDPEFAEAWDEALASAMDVLEAVAFDRAVNGAGKTIVRSSGDKVEIHQYSDRLLMFMLSRRKPESYAALTGPVSAFAKQDRLCAEIEARIAEAEARRAGGDT